MRIFQAPPLNERGFTLLELSFVLVILGLMVVLVYPKLSHLLAGDDLRITALRLAGTIERVRSQAASTKRPYRLNYSLDAHEVWVTALEDGEFASNSAVFSGRRALPAGISFAEVSITGAGKPSSGERFTTFYPNGYVDPSAIYLRDTRGRIYSVIINPLTGRATVHDQYVEQRAVLEPQAE